MWGYSSKCTLILWHIRVRLLNLQHAVCYQDNVHCTSPARICTFKFDLGTKIHCLAYHTQIVESQVPGNVTPKDRVTPVLPGRRQELHPFLRVPLLLNHMTYRGGQMRSHDNVWPTGEVTWQHMKSGDIAVNMTSHSIDLLSNQSVVAWFLVIGKSNQ